MGRSGNKRGTPHFKSDMTKELESDGQLHEPLPYIKGATTLWNNSWSYIYEHFGQTIIAYARRQGLSDHSAEDVLQEVMATLIRCQHAREPAYDREKVSFQKWLWGVIKNRVRSIRRKDQKEAPFSPLNESENAPTETRPLPEILQEAPDFAQSEEDEWLRAMFAAVLKKVEQRAKPQTFAIYIALLEENATVRELAARFQKDENAIHQARNRCKDMFLEELETIKSAWRQLARTPGQ
jgi:RNA polymerase sigma factor (sigma-70 family)